MNVYIENSVTNTAIKQRRKGSTRGPKLFMIVVGGRRDGRETKEKRKGRVEEKS